MDVTPIVADTMIRLVSRSRTVTVIPVALAVFPVHVQRTTAEVSVRSVFATEELTETTGAGKGGGGVKLMTSRAFEFAPVYSIEL